jgi:hypothetical protein
VPKVNAEFFSSDLRDVLIASSLNFFARGKALARVFGHPAGKST